VSTLRRPEARCERVRSWISLELDNELSELEGVQLRAHLRECAACREFQAGADAFTARLREAPLEPLERPIALPERRRALLLRPAQVGAAAAAAVVVAIIGAGTVASVGSNHSTNVVGASSRDDALTFRTVRRQAILSSVPVLVGKAGGRPTS
jgi:predicted anti-sigma-YlaC factor YlaD